jgi:hypothetical protein
MGKHYVYTHTNPKNNDVFYVGLGTGNRAHNKWAGRNKFWDNYVNKHGFNVEIIADNLTRKQAEKIEMKLIAELGRRQIDEGGILVNRSSGGEGSTGYTHTEEFKRKLSEQRKGKCTRKVRKLSPEAKAKISNKLKGRKGSRNRITLQYDKQGNFIREWGSAKEAELVTGARSIWEVASGYQNQKYKSSGGYVWRFK